MRDEFMERQRRLRGLLAERGYDAAIAWSRGGGTQVHYADVLYLAGFYTPQPFVPDRQPAWRAAGHAAVVVSAAGPSTVVSTATSCKIRDPWQTMS